MVAWNIARAKKFFFFEDGIISFASRLVIARIFNILGYSKLDF